MKMGATDEEAKELYDLGLHCGKSTYTHSYFEMQDLIEWINDRTNSEQWLEILFTEDGVYASILYEDNKDIPPLLRCCEEELFDALMELAKKLEEIK